MDENELNANKNIPGIREFLYDYPNMAIKPTFSPFILLKGTFSFRAKLNNDITITDHYRLRIQVPYSFPRQLPDVIEIGKKIPQNPEFHINEDRTLCLGSPLRLLWLISKKPTMTGYAEYCLVPYLYAISYKLKMGGDFPWGELSHGSPGELDDYTGLFGLQTHDQARYALKLLEMKKRIANKKKCPCGCNQKLGKCKFNNKLRKFRELTDRSWFRALVSLK